MAYSIREQSATFGMTIKGLESIQAMMGACMKILEHNQANLGTCMKNIKMNQVKLGASLKDVETGMGQLSQSLRENLPKSFLSDTKKNLKQCMAVTLRSGKEFDEPKKIEDDEELVDQKNLEVEEKMEAGNDKEGVELS